MDTMNVVCLFYYLLSSLSGFFTLWSIILFSNLDSILRTSSCPLDHLSNSTSTYCITLNPLSIVEDPNGTMNCNSPLAMQQCQCSVRWIPQEVLASIDLFQVREHCHGVSPGGPSDNNITGASPHLPRRWRFAATEPTPSQTWSTILPTPIATLPTPTLACLPLTLAALPRWH